MKAAISYISKSEEAVKLFENYMKIYEGQKGKYATLKKLFLDKYKMQYNALKADEMAKVDGLAKEYEEADKTAKERNAA